MPRQINETLQLLVFDFDGVLTDNRVLIFENGLEAVFCNRSDGLAFDMIRAAGIPVLILSTEQNPVVTARAAKLKVPVLQAVQDKRQALTEHCHSLGIDLHSVAFVGNDINDLPAMQIVGFPIAVADAHENVKAQAWTVLNTKGGDGVVREVIDGVLALKEN